MTRQSEQNLVTKNYKRFAVVLMTLVFVGLFVPFPEVTTVIVTLPFQTSYKDSAELELGDERIDVRGHTGEEQVEYESERSLIARFLGAEVVERKIESKVVRQPIDSVVTRGTRRWQYMLCSNGQYRYFTDEQMNDKNTGFTSKSTDFCAENGHGRRVSLADAPPVSSPHYARPLYVPPHTDGYNLPQIQVEPYVSTTPTYSPPALKEYSVPEQPKITTRPLSPSPARTCTYYQGNGVCF